MDVGYSFGIPIGDFSDKYFISVYINALQG